MLRVVQTFFGFTLRISVAGSVCYGETLIETPNFDRLAARGIRFDRFYTPAGVCSATRSATIVGAMQTSFGIHNHRSGRPNFRGQTMGAAFDDIRLPAGG